MRLQDNQYCDQVATTRAQQRGSRSPRCLRTAWVRPAYGRTETAQADKHQQKVEHWEEFYQEKQKHPSQQQAQWRQGVRCHAVAAVGHCEVAPETSAHSSKFGWEPLEYAVLQHNIETIRIRFKVTRWIIRAHTCFAFSRGSAEHTVSSLARRVTKHVLASV